MFKKKHGQIVIEFLLLLAMAFFVIIILLASVFAVYTTNTKIKSYDDLNDLGISLQEEFLLAAQLEDGYIRNINLPTTVNGLRYNATLGQSNLTNNASQSYIALTYESVELFYEIPKVIGTIYLGDNTIKKNNGSVTIN